MCFLLLLSLKAALTRNLICMQSLMNINFFNDVFFSNEQTHNKIRKTRLSYNKYNHYEGQRPSRGTARTSQPAATTHLIVQTAFPDGDL